MTNPKTHHSTWMRTLTLLVAAVAAWVALALPALAVAPIKQEGVDRSGTAVLTGVCPFDVDVSFTNIATDTLFFDKDGNLKRIHGHVAEQDVFSANGKTLEGLPYTFNVNVLFDPETGLPTNVFASGVISRVELPGGGLFLTAGRLDFITAGTGFVLQPEVGAQGDVAGFCEALS